MCVDETMIGSFVIITDASFVARPDGRNCAHRCRWHLCEHTMRREPCDAGVGGLRATRWHECSRNVCGRARGPRARGATGHPAIVARHFSGTKPMGDFPEFSMSQRNAGVAPHAACSLMNLLQNDPSDFGQNEANARFEDRFGATENNARFLGNEANARLLNDFSYFGRKLRTSVGTPNGKVRSSAFTGAFLLEARKEEPPKGGTPNISNCSTPISFPMIATSSPEKLIPDLVPVDHILFGLLRREEPHTEFSFRRLERRHERQNVRMRRDIIGVA